MGKLSAAQKQSQETIESIIDKTEQSYISLAAKPFELAAVVHSFHDDVVAKLAASLSGLNKQIGKLGNQLLAKVEKDETKTDRAKRVISNAGRNARKTVSKNAKAANEAIQTANKKVERTLN